MTTAPHTPLPVDAGPRSTTTALRRLLLIGWALAGITMPLILALAAGPRWWRYIAAEQTPMTWLQSVVLILCAALCLQLCVLQRGRQIGLWRGRQISAGVVWGALGLGFLALALDERFAIHERVRDRILAPAGVRIPLLSWIGPGDFLMLLVALGGLLVLPAIWRTLTHDRWARNVFACAVGLSILAVGADSVDPSRMSLTALRWEQTLEECVEYLAGLGYLSALTLTLMTTLRRVIDSPIEFDESPHEAYTAPTRSGPHLAASE